MFEILYSIASCFSPLEDALFNSGFGTKWARVGEAPIHGCVEYGLPWHVEKKTCTMRNPEVMLHKNAEMDWFMAVKGYSWSKAPLANELCNPYDPASATRTQGIRGVARTLGVDLSRCFFIFSIFFHISWYQLIKTWIPRWRCQAAWNTWSLRGRGITVEAVTLQLRPGEDRVIMTLGVPKKLP